MWSGGFDSLDIHRLMIRLVLFSVTPNRKLEGDLDDSGASGTVRFNTVQFVFDFFVNPDLIRKLVVSKL